MGCVLHLPPPPVSADALSSGGVTAAAASRVRIMAVISSLQYPSTRIRLRSFSNASCPSAVPYAARWEDAVLFVETLPSLMLEPPESSGVEGLYNVEQSLSE